MKPLLFSEFRISYAKEIMEYQSRRENRGKPMDYLIIELYSWYLTVCGFDEFSRNKILPLKQKICLVHICGEKDGHNEDYDPEFIKNINTEIDKIVTDYFEIKTIPIILDPDGWLLYKSMSLNVPKVH